MLGSRTAKSCGPDAPTLASSSRKASRPYRVRTSHISAGDGGKRARSPGRARDKLLKPLRAGMPGESGGPVVATLVCHQHFAHEAAGAAGTRHSPRPLFFGAKDLMHDPGATRRGIADSCLGCLKFESGIYTVIASVSETIHRTAKPGAWIASSRSLSSGAHFARPVGSSQ